MDSVTYYTDRIRKDTTGLHQEAEYLARHHHEWPATVAPDALRQLAVGACEAAERLNKVAADALAAAEHMVGDEVPPVGLNAAQRRDWLRTRKATA